MRERLQERAGRAYQDGSNCVTSEVWPAGSFQKSDHIVPFPPTVDSTPSPVEKSLLHKVWCQFSDTRENHTL